MKFASFWSRLVLLCAASLVAACNSSDPTPEPSVAAERIHLLSAPSGNLAPLETPTGQAWRLTLDQVPLPALWYADRPARDSGSVALAQYLGQDWQTLYQNIPPNATLIFSPGGGESLVALYVSLSEPHFDTVTRRVQFQVTLIDGAQEQLSPEGVTFTRATLNVLNNAGDRQEVSSYVQYAQSARFEAGNTTGKQALVLEQAGPEMFWVDNAPGTYSDHRPMSEFFWQWQAIFGEDKPNAALVGINQNGQSRVYFVTLDQAQYDPAAMTVRYDTTLLTGQLGSPEVLNHVVLLIDSGAFNRFPVPGKGVAYQAFSQGYNPSTANQSYIYFGSDIARREMGSLWGTTSNLQESCAPYCRDDLKTIQSMGGNLIRLYDWDPINDHSQFLDYANSLGLKVVVPISNWLAMQTPDIWAQQLPSYFKHGNYGNQDGTDWHPAIAGVIISNELNQASGGGYYSNAIGLTAAFLKMAEDLKFSSSVLVGVPVSFLASAPGSGSLPAWSAFDQLVNDPRLAAYQHRLMLCTNTYNSGDYLYENAESTGKGWVPLTWERYGLPILFTEIGLSRTESYFTPSFILQQLEDSIAYQKQYPEQLLGVAHFQFSNKVWEQTANDSNSEGAFGAWSHGQVLKQIQTTKNDYDYYKDYLNGNYGVLTIDELAPTATHDPVVQAYQP